MTSRILAEPDGRRPTNPAGGQVARIVARAILAAAAFWFALLVLPRLSWNADSSLLPRMVILAIVGIVNGLVPQVVDRFGAGGEEIGRLRRVASTIAVNAALVFAIAVVAT